MTKFGYTLMTEQSGPRELVRYAVAAEGAGFDFEVCSDHYSPWLIEQGHAPYAWTVLGAVAHATSRVGLMTYVTCPTMRYHPAVVAQKAATLQILAEGRFTLGLGSGENLNEHVVGEGWPGIQDRHDMLVEAVEVIRELHTGELVDYRGQYYQVDSARVWDVPEEGVEIGIAVAGDRAIEMFAPLGDHLIGVEPSSSLVEGWNDVDGCEAGGERGTGDRTGPDLLGPRPRHRGQEGARAVPLVRWRLARERRSADAGRVLRRHPVRPARGRRRRDPLRTRPRRRRRGRERLLEGWLHRRRDRADRRRRAGPVPRRGGRTAPGEAARRGTRRCRMTAAVLLDIDGFGQAELEDAGALRVEELPTDLLELDWSQEVHR
ncbi:TIGR03557 family F420-dependent LLM class oxidoreductase [Nocardioides bizhenqiangii]|uniref:TIGR03557 family F420-dependent LLM class oxidoreductase n=1 Tax=Nocardioides bizhenqiangii TaxID=3095076 RepID=A0ABZ0ZWR0_9ACTN|nr:TIGR03557 family F420-dependent LLM class oxidoreductase [Nocardioides sp. HM61]WQQ28176.1 TIGR03557 family F420-dependent LLM class oxidoreductase [Nocardioides sp. HM61]